MKKKIILCRGIQASGKSTFSKEWAQEAPDKRVRLCYDDLRWMMGSPDGYWVPSREHMLGKLRDSFMAAAMAKGYDIIIDNMNLNPKEIEYYKTLVSKNPSYELEYHDFFDVSLQECIRRDSLRPSPIGAAVLTATYNRYKSIIEGKEDSK